MQQDEEEQREFRQQIGALKHESIRWTNEERTTMSRSMSQIIAELSRSSQSPKHPRSFRVYSQVNTPSSSLQSKWLTRGCLKLLFVNNTTPSLSTSSPFHHQQFFKFKISSTTSLFHQYTYPSRSPHFTSPTSEGARPQEHIEV